MKFAAERPYADPEKAARKLVEIANSVEPAQDGRIFIELINWPFLSEHKGHSASVRSVWYRLTGRLCCCRVIGVHMAKFRLVQETPWNHGDRRCVNLIRNSTDRGRKD
jgi:hypothetical protein